MAESFPCTVVRVLMAALPMVLASPFGAMAIENGQPGDAPPGIRLIGSTIYTLDAKGHTNGTLKEVTPGNWRIMNMKGDTIRTLHVPPGCVPFTPCPAGR